MVGLRFRGRAGDAIEGSRSQRADTAGGASLGASLRFLGKSGLSGRGGTRLPASAGWLSCAPPGLTDRRTAAASGGSLQKPRIEGRPPRERGGRPGVMWTKELPDRPAQERGWDAPR